MYNTQQQNGWTLIEILVALGVIVILFALTISTFSRYRQASDFTTATDFAVALFSDIRTKTLSSENSNQFGIHIEEDSLVSFTGSVYNPADPTNKIFPLPATVHITSILLVGGGSEVIFERLTGETTQMGTITYNGKGTHMASSTIRISSTGFIVK
jgi:prepilin-type N-terminal cleavage/methylation domain-containing protein